MILRSWPAKWLPDVMPHSLKVRAVAMFEAVQEIAIYIHRFHNLDLFQQGWYQIKITMRWEDDEDVSFGIPARVVQYEEVLLELLLVCLAMMAERCLRMLAVGNLFSLCSSVKADKFSIPYKLDWALSVAKFYCIIQAPPTNMSFLEFETSAGHVLPTTAVILKFELMYAPTFENGADLQASLDAYPAAVHEFRIPPKALLGLHSYCPVHFDALHAVLVDVSIHVSLLKAASTAPRNSRNAEFVANKSYDTLDQGLSDAASVKLKAFMIVKALLTAHGILLEELQKLSKAVDQAIDIPEFVSKRNDMKLINSVPQANQFTTEVEISGQRMPQNGLEGADRALDFETAEKLRSLSKRELLNCYHSVGNRLLYLWNIFLKFHRDNKTKILEFLHDAWAKDRKAEWSIWMVYSKVEMPHHYINSGVHRRVSSLWKLPDEINNRSIQDMHIFGDPSSIPIVIVERVMNAPRRTISDNSYLRQVELVNSHSFQTGLNLDTANKISAPQTSTRVLKIVVFVHGFQASLTLELLFFFLV
ncbi:hypothetical protein JHK85_048609 [Glycine max]|nr:hypothetical protein JHK85_048609 [Glycine max]